MNRRSSWCWARWIDRSTEEAWTARLACRAGGTLLVIERPGRKRLLLEAHFARHRNVAALQRKWGGRTHQVLPVREAPSAPRRISKDLTIVHGPRAPSREELAIPFGMAFGSGEHATTLMLLRAMARRVDWSGTTFLDLGTGSGILALLARKLGAQRIAAIDFDSDAIRTARQNEMLNFRGSAIEWKVADVKRLPSSPTFSLIAANLFSGILMDAAPRIARLLRRGGELWLSGVLRNQSEDVARAFRHPGLRLLKTNTHGRWVMQQWRKD